MKNLILFLTLGLSFFSYAQENQTIEEMHAEAEQRNKDDDWTSICKHSTYTSDQVKTILNINEQTIIDVLKEYDSTFFDNSTEYLVNDDVISIIGYYLIKYGSPTSGRYYTVKRFYTPAKNDYFPIFEPYFKQYDVPKAFMVMPIAETDLNEDAVSNKGAVGLWQFKAATARYHGGLTVNDRVDERKNRSLSSKAAAKYLAHLYNYFGTWHFAALGYNVSDKVLSEAITNSFIGYLPTKIQWEKFREALIPENFCHLNRIVALSYVFAHYDATL